MTVMKVVIKRSNKKTAVQKRQERVYKTKCWNCKCKFIYQDEDVTPDPINMLYRVDCPNCGYINLLNWKIRCFNPYKITKGGTNE